MPKTTKFIVETRTLPHIFARAVAQAMQAVYQEQEAGSTVMEKLSVEAADPSLLLQAWINQVIRFFQEKHIVLSVFDVRQLGPKDEGWYLQVEATGKQLDLKPTGHSTILCSAAEISGDEQSCHAEFILDYSERL